MSDSTEAANSEILKVLENNEDHVISLTKLKPTDLIEEMFWRCIISDSMMDQFSNLDHSRVDPQLQLRYLLRLVTQRTKEDGSVGDKFLNLLESRGEHSLCEYLRRSSVGEKEPEAKRMCLDTSLNDGDLKWILEVLVQVSPDWEMLGTALDLPLHSIKNSREDSNVKSLRKLLIEWLSGGTATVSALTQALRSELVGKPRVALEVEEKFRSLNTAISAPCATTANTSSLAFTIIYQSGRNIEVEDGKSTLLLVQTSQRENVSYQWNNNGQPLADNNLYSGVHDDLLVINHTHQGMDGEYTCCVRSQEREIGSNKVTLSVLYPPEKETLLERYSKKTHVKDWPPVGTKTFINLALSSQSIYSIFGDPDDILNNVEQVEYEEVFTIYKRAALILVEGRPCSGKTTLVHKLIKDWKQGKVLVEARLVFLVFLRSLGEGASHTLSIILQNFYSNQEELIAIISKTEKSNGKGVCFVFDGLDEYHPQEEDNSVVFKLLHKIYLPETMIIVTSRPGAMGRLKEEAVTQQIEVFGFSKEQISEYIDNFPFGSLLDGAYGSKDLKEYLKLHSNILYMCYLPIHAAIICFVYKTERGHLPDTQTKIYKEFTRSMILRHLRHKNKETKLKSLKDLQGCSKEYFNKLCHLAFNMTLKGQQIIDEDNLKDFQLNEATAFPGDWSLGLVSCNRIAQLCGVCTFYTFLHLTLQEFLAAYYIANTKGREKCELIQRFKITFFIFGFSNIWTYYFGLETFESENELSILNNVFSLKPSILKATKLFALPKSTNIIKRFKLAHESQQQIVCDEIVRQSDGIVNQKNIHPSDVPALVYIICTTSHPIIEINLSFRQDYDVHHVLKQIQSTNFLKLQVLIIDAVINDPSTVQCLNNMLKSCNNIKEIGLYQFDLPANLANTLKHLANLTHLTLRHSSCGHHYSPFHYTKYPYGVNIPSSTISKLNTGSVAVINQIHNFSHLKYLNISHWRFDLNCCRCLASNISHLSNLEYLALRYNGICSDGIIMLAQALHNLTKLKILDLSGNNICSNGIRSLTPGLHSLTVLDLSGNQIGLDGIKSLAPELHHLTNLAVLNLSHNNIGSDGANCLASELHHLSKLTALNLIKNKIGSAGANGLASELHHLTQLNVLSLAMNDINPHSVIKLITSLKDCRELSYVSLSNTSYRLPPKRGFLLNHLRAGTKESENLMAAIRQHNIDADIHLGFRTTIHVGDNPKSAQNHLGQKSRLCDCQ